MNNFFKKKKILITGATGFKGTWLSLWLHLMGANVLACGLKKNSQKFFFEMKLNKRINTKLFDINNFCKLKKVMDNFKPEIIFHLAAQPLVQTSFFNPRETFETNINGTINVLEICKASNYARAIICITTDKVYKNNIYKKCYSEDDALQGEDPYSASKASADIIANSYLKSFFSKKKLVGLSVVRAGNVIGGGDLSENRLIPDCIKKLLKRKIIMIRNPNYVRPWQYVLEPIYGYLLLAINLYKKPKKFSMPFNFGSSFSSSEKVNNIVKKVIKIWGRGKCYNVKNKDKYKEQSYLKLNSNKAFKVLKWKNILNNNAMIEYAVSWYKKVLFEKKDVYMITKNQLVKFNKLTIFRNFFS